MDKNETLKYIGNLSQIGGCRHYTLSDGWGRGMRATDINTGGGLQYTVLPDRGLDISLAGYRGVNLVYLTCNGETHPAYYEPEGLGWLHTFTGGLLMVNSWGSMEGIQPYLSDNMPICLNGKATNTGTK
jgi:hypothetical protein